MRVPTVPSGIALTAVMGFTMVLGACADRRAVVARVGRDAIGTELVKHWARLGAASSGEVEEARALRLLLAAEWFRGQARRDRIRVNRSDIARQLALYEYASTRRSNAVAVPHERELGPYLKSPLATRADRMWLMELATIVAEVERERLRLAERGIRHQQVADYYRAHRRSLVSPERRTVAILETTGLREARAARREIEGGEPFVRVARRVTVDPRARDGIKADVLRGEGAPALSAAIFKARPGRLVGPLRVAIYYLFEVLKVTPARAIHLREAEPRIRRVLAERVTNTALARRFVAYWGARTSCAAGVSACEARTADLSAPEILALATSL